LEKYNKGLIVSKLKEEKKEEHIGSFQCCIFQVPLCLEERSLGNQRMHKRLVKIKSIGIDIKFSTNPYTLRLTSRVI